MLALERIGQKPMAESATLTIVFYHDVLCPWCLPMSRRLRRLQREWDLPVRIEHRCYALIPEPKDLQATFGSFAAAKRAFLAMWRDIAQLPECRDVRPERMERRTFRFPHSTPALWSCKIAEWQHGQEGHWRMFELLQEALFVRAENIASLRVLRRIARQCGLSIAQWEQAMGSAKVRRAVQQDQREAHHWGIFGVPALVINDAYVLQGEVSYEVLRAELQALVSTS